MEITKEIHQAIIVSQRFSTMEQKSKIAHDAITDVFHADFNWISPEQITILYDAQKILNKLRQKTSSQHASEYLKTL